MYELYVEDDCNNINALWEIQLRESLTFTFPVYENVFLIKHVATGCFLSIDPLGGDNINLTYDGLQREC